MSWGLFFVIEYFNRIGDLIAALPFPQAKEILRTAKLSIKVMEEHDQSVSDAIMTVVLAVEDAVKYQVTEKDERFEIMFKK